MLCMLGNDGLISRFLVVFKCLCTCLVFKEYLVQIQDYSKRQIVSILCVKLAYRMFYKVASRHNISLGDKTLTGSSLIAFLNCRCIVRGRNIRDLQSNWMTYFTLLVEMFILSKVCLLLRC